jgi:hypothetical protein
MAVFIGSTRSKKEAVPLALRRYAESIGGEVSAITYNHQGLKLKRIVVYVISKRGDKLFEIEPARMKGWLLTSNRFFEGIPYVGTLISVVKRMKTAYRFRSPKPISKR